VMATRRHAATRPTPGRDAHSIGPTALTARGTHAATRRARRRHDVMRRRVSDQAQSRQPHAA
jgi:hypothetical protein